MKNSKSMRVVSLFSGAGGLDLGFKMAGFDIVWANDIDEYAVATYHENIGEECVCQNISNSNFPHEKHELFP